MCNNPHCFQVLLRRHKPIAWEFHGASILPLDILRQTQTRYRLPPNGLSLNCTSQATLRHEQWPHYDIRVQPPEYPGKRQNTILIRFQTIMVYVFAMHTSFDIYMQRKCSKRPHPFLGRKPLLERYQTQHRQHRHHRHHRHRRHQQRLTALLACAVSHNFHRKSQSNEDCHNIRIAMIVSLRPPYRRHGCHIRRVGTMPVDGLVQLRYIKLDKGNYPSKEPLTVDLSGPLVPVLVVEPLLVPVTLYLLCYLYLFHSIFYL